MKGCSQISIKHKMVKIIIVNEQRYNMCTDGKGLIKQTPESVFKVQMLITLCEVLFLQEVGLCCCTEGTHMMHSG